MCVTVLMMNMEQRVGVGLALSCSVSLPGCHHRHLYKRPWERLKGHLALITAFWEPPLRAAPRNVAAAVPRCSLLSSGNDCLCWPSVEEHKQAWRTRWNLTRVPADGCFKLYLRQIGRHWYDDASPPLISGSVSCTACYSVDARWRRERRITLRLKLNSTFSGCWD